MVTRVKDVGEAIGQVDSFAIGAGVVCVDGEVAFSGESVRKETQKRPLVVARLIVGGERVRLRNNGCESFPEVGDCLVCLNAELWDDLEQSRVFAGWDKSLADHVAEFTPREDALLWGERGCPRGRCSIEICTTILDFCFVRHVRAAEKIVELLDPG